jgi:dihydrofolate reductase
VFQAQACSYADRPKGQFLAAGRDCVNRQARREHPADGAILRRRVAERHARRPPGNARGGPCKDALNKSPKYAAPTTLEEPLPWPNSTLLRGDIADALRTLKAQSGGVLAIMGSGELIGSLMAADLIDEYLLMIHPLVLGAGRRLFPKGQRASLRLIDSITTATGIVIATYESAKD